MLFCRWLLSNINFIHDLIQFRSVSIYNVYNNHCALLCCAKGNQMNVLPFSLYRIHWDEYAERFSIPISICPQLIAVFGFVGFVSFNVIYYFHSWCVARTISEQWCKRETVGECFAVCCVADLMLRKSNRPST